jgi:hypothetical protein
MTTTTNNTDRELAETELYHVAGGYGTFSAYPRTGYSYGSFTGPTSGVRSTGTGSTLAHEPVHAS